MTHKNKTAAAMGMLNLYEVSINKMYIHQQSWYIKADNLKEAQRKWGSYNDIRFIDQQHSDPDIHYYYRKVREIEYDYDQDNTGEYVDEVKFDKKNDLHKLVVDEMYDNYETSDGATILKIVKKDEKR